MLINDQNAIFKPNLVSLTLHHKPGLRLPEVGMRGYVDLKAIYNVAGFLIVDGDLRFPSFQGSRFGVMKEKSH